MRRATRREDGEPVAAPAVITPMHRQDRPVFDAITGREVPGKRAFRNESQWQRFLRLKQHVCKDACTDPTAERKEIEKALDRRDAGNTLANAWTERAPGSRDSTDLSPRGGGTSDGLTTAMVAAGKLLGGLQAHMGQNDWMLVRRVCGEDYSAPQAVAEISPSYRDATLPRFREALDALHNARVLAAKCQWCRAGRPHGSVLHV